MQADRQAVKRGRELGGSGGGGRGRIGQGWQERRVRKEGRGWEEAANGKGIRDWGGDSPGGDVLPRRYRQIINCLLRLRMRLTVFNSVIRTAAKCEGGYREREDRCLKEKLWRKGEGGAHNWGTHKKTTTTEARSYFLPHTFNQDPSRDLDRMSSCGKTYRGEGFRHWLFLSSNGLPKPPCPCHALPQRAQAGVASFSKRRSSVPVCHFSLNAVRNLDCVPH
jgi:hypothetical protein